MPIIDSQVHVYEANTPKRPWHSVPNWPDHDTGEEMVAALGKVGVDGAIFISAFSMYQYDASYAVEVQRAPPGKFGIVKPVNPDDPAVADVIADWKKTPGTVGIRIMMTKEAQREPDDRGLDRILRARPAPGAWSALEYACHARDSFLIYDERVSTTVKEDRPSFPRMGRDRLAL